MNMRGASVALLFVVILMVDAVSIDGYTSSLLRAMERSWFSPAAEAQDVLSDQESVSTDPARDAQKATLPIRDAGEPYVAVHILGPSRIISGAALSRSPPSA